MTALVTGAEIAGNLQLTYADDTDGFDQVASVSDRMVSALLTATDGNGDPIDHGTHDPCVEAALILGTELYQARTAVGGQPVGFDYTPGPVKVSRWMTERARVLAAACPDGGLDVGGMVG